LILREVQLFSFSLARAQLLYAKPFNLLLGLLNKRPVHRDFNTIFRRLFIAWILSVTYATD